VPAWFEVIVASVERASCVQERVFEGLSRVGARGGDLFEGGPSVFAVLLAEMASRLDDPSTASLGEARSEFTGAAEVAVFGQEPCSVGVDSVGEWGADVAGKCGVGLIEFSDGHFVIAARVPDPRELEVRQQEEDGPTGLQDVDAAFEELFGFVQTVVLVSERTEGTEHLVGAEMPFGAVCHQRGSGGFGVAIR